MKIFYWLLIGLLSVSDSYSQIKKIHLSSDGKFIDGPKKASSYLLINKLSDSAYAVEKYNLRDTIMLRGIYLDSLLTLPNGRFVTYTKKTIDYRFKELFHTDTNNFIGSIGYYSKGLKTGMWTEFEKRGIKRCTYIYKNDKLNGHYQRFNKIQSPYVEEEGDYLDDKREGEWNLYGYDTIKTPVASRTYSNDKLIKEVIHIKRATVPKDMGKYFLKKLKKIDTLSLEINTEVTVDTNGAIKNPRIVSSFSPERNAIIMDALKNMPPLKPQIHDDKPEEMTCLFKIGRTQSFNNPDGVVDLTLVKAVGNGLEFGSVYIDW